MNEREVTLNYIERALEKATIDYDASDILKDSEFGVGVLCGRKSAFKEILQKLNKVKK